MVQDTSIIKEKILSFLRAKGPGLPVHISGEIKSNILFSSAFLSELVSEKRIKMSNMRVGSSPVYYVPGQEYLLERFSQHLKSKEKEAFILLREKKFLVDSMQQPAIRVALREIRDFALPFKHGEEIIWRYFLIPESEFKKKEAEKEIKIEIPVELKKDIIKETVKEPVKEVQKEKEKPLDIFKKTTEKKKTKRKPQPKEKFFEKVKESLSQKSIQLKDIESFSKNEIMLRVIDNGEEKILIAYNKKKISDNDIIKAHKKVSDKGLPYMLLSLSEPSKKTSELLRAMKDLSSIKGLK
jgi:hypothetical protein